MKPTLVVENDYIMIPVDVLDQYRAKKPKKVKQGMLMSFKSL